MVGVGAALGAARLADRVIAPRMLGRDVSASERYVREGRFYDVSFARFVERPRRVCRKYYAADRASRQFYRQRLAAAEPGTRILEYGCGLGSSAFSLARQGCLVTGIDISAQGIRQARARAETEQLPIRFEVMNAEELEFEDDSFDLVCGSGILHHLDLQRAYPEVARVATSAGRAVFLEPLGHNPLINLYRRATPALRTVDEHPLLIEDLRMAVSHFKAARATFFSLLTLAAVPLRETGLFEPILGTLERLDRLLFKIPLVRHLAWQVVLELEQPAAPKR
jgi:SAM-dependent methyltransferase